jgi:hypothetical protein
LSHIPLGDKVVREEIEVGSIQGFNFRLRANLLTEAGNPLIRVSTFDLHYEFSRVQTADTIQKGRECRRSIPDPTFSGCNIQIRGFEQDSFPPLEKNKADQRIRARTPRCLRGFRSTTGRKRRLSLRRCIEKLFTRVLCGFRESFSGRQHLISHLSLPATTIRNREIWHRDQTFPSRPLDFGMEFISPPRCWVS